MTTYREAAIALWGEAGACVHDAYTRWLPLYPGLPAEIPIVIGITAYGKCWGLTRPEGEWQSGGPRITIGSNRFAAGTNLVADIMVHEMLHIWLHHTGQNTQHDHAAWYGAVRRLSPLVLGHELDLPSYGGKSVRVPNPRYGEPNQPRTVVRKKAPEGGGVIGHAYVASWPYSFRPPGWDHGTPIPCPSY